PEAGIAAFLQSASRHGAEIRTEEPGGAWAPDGDGGRVTTRRGVLRADHGGLAAGAWVPGLLPGRPLRGAGPPPVLFVTGGVRRAHDMGSCPISIWEHEPGRFFYSFPRDERGVKVAIHMEGEPADPDRLDRDVRADEVARMRALVQRYMPFASGPLVASAVCM